MKSILRGLFLLVMLVAGAGFAQTLPPDIISADNCIYYNLPQKIDNSVAPTYTVSGTCTMAANPTTVYVFGKRQDKEYAETTCQNGLWSVTFNPARYLDGTVPNDGLYIFDTKPSAQQVPKSPNTFSTQPTLDLGAAAWRDILYVKSQTTVQGVPQVTALRFFYPKLCPFGKNDKDIRFDAPVPLTDITLASNNTQGAVTPITPSGYTFSGLCYDHSAKMWDDGAGGFVTGRPSRIFINSESTTALPCTRTGPSEFDGVPGTWVSTFQGQDRFSISKQAPTGFVAPGDDGAVRLRAKFFVSQVRYEYVDPATGQPAVQNKGSAGTDADRTWNPIVHTQHPFITNVRTVGGVVRPGQCNLAGAQVFNVRCSPGTSVRIVRDIDSSVLASQQCNQNTSTIPSPVDVSMVIGGYAYNDAKNPRAHFEYTDDYGNWQPSPGGPWTFYTCANKPCGDGSSSCGPGDWF